MTIDTQAMEWAVREADTGLDAPARAQFNNWREADIRHEGAYLRALAILHTVDAAASEHASSPAPVKFDAGLDRRFGKSANTRSWWISGALAAGLAVVLTFSFKPAEQHSELIATTKGEQRQVVLADRSSVKVNSSTRIEAAIGDEERRVRLIDGEAWFAVAKDPARPFVVEAGELRVRAVGTAFSVRRHARGTEVLVTEGVVEVWRDGGPVRTRLGAGELARADPSAARITTAREPREIERALAWREGKLVFHDQTLDEAVREFNRYNARPIVVADPTLASATVVGQYRIDRPEQFARDMQQLLNAPVLVTDSSIAIGVRSAK